MDDLQAFLTARVDELERADWHILDCPGMPDPDGFCCDVGRWLVRDVAAKRALIRLHDVSHDPCDAHGPGLESVPCDVVLLMATAWSNHRDFDPAWVAQHS